MKLLLVGHDDRYAIEQLQLSLFSGLEPVDAPFTGDGAVSDGIWYGGDEYFCLLFN